MIKRPWYLWSVFFLLCAVFFTEVHVQLGAQSLSFTANPPISPRPPVVADDGDYRTFSTPMPQGWLQTTSGYLGSMHIFQRAQPLPLGQKERPATPPAASWFFQNVPAGTYDFYVTWGWSAAYAKNVTLVLQRWVRQAGGAYKLTPLLTTLIDQQKPPAGPLLMGGGTRWQKLGTVQTTSGSGISYVLALSAPENTRVSADAAMFYPIGVVNIQMQSSASSSVQSLSSRSSSTPSSLASGKSSVGASSTSARPASSMVSSGFAFSDTSSQRVKSVFETDRNGTVSESEVRDGTSRFIGTYEKRKGEAGYVDDFDFDGNAIVDGKDAVTVRQFLSVMAQDGTQKWLSRWMNVFLSLALD